MPKWFFCVLLLRDCGDAIGMSGKILRCGGKHPLNVQAAIPVSVQKQSLHSFFQWWPGVHGLSTPKERFLLLQPSSVHKGTRFSMMENAIKILIDMMTFIRLNFQAYTWAVTSVALNFPRRSWRAFRRWWSLSLMSLRSAQTSCTKPCNSISCTFAAVAFLCINTSNVNWKFKWNIYFIDKKINLFTSTFTSFGWHTWFGGKFSFVCETSVLTTSSQSSRQLVMFSGAPHKHVLQSSDSVAFWRTQLEVSSGTSEPWKWS